MPALLTLDLGTTSAKAALIDLEGRTIASASAGYSTHHTPDGGTEQDPADWVRTAHAALARTLPPGAEVAALCLTGQMQDLILEGEHGAAHPAVLYTDLRATTESDEIHAALAVSGEDWDALTGNLQDASSCAAMFGRLARTSPEAVARTRGLTFGPAGHLTYVLGAGLYCDLTTAAATGLLDARTRNWSPAVARAAGIDETLLPRLTSELGQIVGHTGESAAELIGLPAGIPLVLAPGDAGAAALGITGTAPGEDHASLGTSGWIASIRTAQQAATVDGASHRLALAGNAELHISAILAAGAAAAWARGAYLGGESALSADARLVERAQKHGRAPTGLLVLPSLGGERFPVRDDSLPGAVLGIDASTTPADLYAGPLKASPSPSPTRSNRKMPGGCCPLSAGERPPRPGGGSSPTSPAAPYSGPTAPTRPCSAPRSPARRPSTWTTASPRSPRRAGRSPSRTRRPQGPTPNCGRRTDGSTTRSRNWPADPAPPAVHGSRETRRRPARRLASPRGRPSVR